MSSGAAQCQSTLATAKSVAQRLQSRYFNPGNGKYTGGSLWTDAVFLSHLRNLRSNLTNPWQNTLEDLHNLMLATGADEFSTVADTSFIGRAALDANTNWQNILAGSNDDAGWIVLTLWKIANYKGSRGLSTMAYLASQARLHQTTIDLRCQFQNSAKKIYDIIAGQWDSTCGGGVWWSTAHTYKNAVTNELFLLLSASGFLRFGDQAYLDNAQKTWNWLLNSGMRNAQGLWNDGLDSATCRNNGQTTWTYNQGVIASGLAALAVANKDPSLLNQAEITLDATIARITTNNILRESCDNAASGGPVCNQDQQIFKGIWTKHLQYYLDTASDPACTAKCSPFLGSQTSAVFHYGTNANNDIGSVWYAPNQARPISFLVVPNFLITSHLSGGIGLYPENERQWLGCPYRSGQS
ncbi:unnamed protein product [Cyclocybe aegerita]|uniref:Glycoside hydrolase family 76 protein n=1 Tax=Cyclocybe aegerita TaxID=1973307 RepID=A0A8S0X042_CYCAE|nr:unnamed protein product [Cyclocybe aegerita]